MKTSWEKQIGDRFVFCFLSDGYVTVGENYGTYATENAGAVTFDAFLTGQYQSSIRSDFGEAVLAEVLAAVKALQGAASTDSSLA